MRVHADLPQLEYYGPGPDSSIHNRTDFRREDTLFEFRAALRPRVDGEVALRAAEHIGRDGREMLRRDLCQLDRAGARQAIQAELPRDECPVRVLTLATNPAREVEPP